MSTASFTPSRDMSTKRPFMSSMFAKAMQCTSTSSLPQRSVSAAYILSISSCLPTSHG